MPRELIVRSYNVGFGDCTLLTFCYDSFSRNILIDFGSVRRPSNSSRHHMQLVARQIVQDCAKSDGSKKLDAIVATHRHKDHISGFATNPSGTGNGDAIRKLEPDIIVQPWTEHPDAPEDALLAPSIQALRVYRNRLSDMGFFAKHVYSQIRSFNAVDGQERRRMRLLGEINIANQSAVSNLQSMANAARDRACSSRHGAYFVYSGSTSGLGHLLPNVKVDVLGPPTLKQSESIGRPVSIHQDEYWHLHGPRMAEFSEERLFPGMGTSHIEPYARWLQRKMERLRTDELFRIVRILDDALNNTSVILLFSINGRGFLFPGDAQWENWEFALNQPEYVEKLRSVELYKVGHHGSLNATPKSLWALFENKGPKGTHRRLQSILSTKDGVHGHPDRDSEIPRETLIDEIEKNSELLDTRSVTDGLSIKSVFRF